MRMLIDPACACGGTGRVSWPGDDPGDVLSRMHGLPCPDCIARHETAFPHCGQCDRTLTHEAMRANGRVWACSEACASKLDQQTHRFDFVAPTWERRPPPPEPVYCTLAEFYADPAGWTAKADDAPRLVVTDDAGKALFIVMQQRDELP